MLEPLSATRSWVTLGKSILSGSDQHWYQAGGSGSQGYLARQGTEWGRVQTFTGPEWALLVQITENMETWKNMKNIICLFRKLRCNFATQNPPEC